MRHISRELFSDEFFGRLAAEHRILWIGMVVHLADDQGRLLDNAAVIAGSIFPYDAYMRDDIVEAGLHLFARNKKIVRYAAGGNGSGRRLIQIVNWWKHQDKALTRWAGRSAFPAPPRWLDRVRIKQPGVKEILELNWHMVGGFSKSRRPATVRLPDGQHPVTALAIEEEEEKNQEEEEDKNLSLPPTSLQPQRGRKADGRTEVASQIRKIIAASSFEDKRKTDSISTLVATRIVDANPIHYVIASFASAHANGRSRDPAAVAVHQLEHDKVNPAFLDPSTWRSIPVQILRAAGIDDLSTYAARWHTEQFMKG